MLLSNASHLKEILVYLKPNNFPRYLEQLTDIESRINAVDATKYQHDVKVNRPVVEEEDKEDKEAKEDKEEKEEKENTEDVEIPNQEEDNVVVVEQESVEVPKDVEEKKDEPENQDGMNDENSTTQSLGPTQPEVLEE